MKTVWQWIHNKDFIKVSFKVAIDGDYTQYLEITMDGDCEIGPLTAFRQNRCNVVVTRSIYYADDLYDDDTLIGILEEMYSEILEIMNFDRQHRKIQ